MKRDVETRLEAVVRDLPREKVLQIIDFADFLRSRTVSGRPQRGSVEAIAQALEKNGPLQFASQELETLLAEIQMMREMDLENDGLPA